ncbi:hypothetical protein DL93DRAFT_2072941 [Clavulina sp. PMI_390]|nr:hypothetical protein DL93DRAFT_2072941 [Clavulina sp. PMI_390]
MWGHTIKRDPRKLLTAIEKVEREEETRIRKLRHDRLENPDGVAGGSGGAGDGSGGGGSGAEASGSGDASSKKRKRKDPGPGVTAKNMSEDMKKKFQDDVAQRAAGGSKKKFAWMNASALTPSASAASAGASTSAASTSGAAGGGGGGTGTTTTTGSTTVNGTSSPYSRPSPLGAGGTTGGWGRANQAFRKGEEDDGTRNLTLVDVEFAIDREKGHGGGRGAARGW